MVKTCAICERKYSGPDFNAWPIKEGFCCRDCDEIVSDAIGVLLSKLASDERNRNERRTPKRHQWRA
jgi:hypothetical protein